MNKINTSNKTANILLLVIDCQNAFINEFTKSYADKISNLVNSKVYKYVAFTKYINTEKFLKVIKDCNLTGYALENCTALEIIDGKEKIIKSNPDKNAYKIYYEDGEYKEIQY